jgi:hypothetical protein
VRRFLETFAGEELEVAVEPTTGWRFVVDELRRIGAEAALPGRVTDISRISIRRSCTEGLSMSRARSLLVARSARRLARLPSIAVGPRCGWSLFSDATRSRRHRLDMRDCAGGGRGV